MKYVLIGLLPQIAFFSSISPRKLSQYYDCNDEVLITYKLPGPLQPITDDSDAVTRRTINFSKLERYVRVSFIAVFAWEMARTYANENYKAYEFYYRSWIELAEELKYTDLAYALRSCKPYKTKEEVDNDVLVEQIVPLLEGKSAQETATALLRQALDAWFVDTVVPVLRVERDMALRPGAERI